MLCRQHVVAGGLVLEMLMQVGEILFQPQLRDPYSVRDNLQQDYLM